MPTTRLPISAASRLKLSLSIIASFLILQLCLVASGQAPAVGPVGDNVQPPQPGIGHDYIHLMSETVNPVRGSLSIRISFPAPKGRGITPPAFAAYNSGELSSLLDNFDTLQWATTSNFIGQDYGGSATRGGWGTSGGTPLSTNSPAYWNVIAPPYPPTGVPPLDCNYMSGLSFTDLNMTQHTLPVGAAWAPNYWNYSGTPSQNCGPGIVVGNGDTQVTAVAPLYTAAQMTAGQWGLPVSIIDNDGNTYSLALGQGLALGNAAMEDRNGNSFGANANGMTDTAGRQLVLGGISPVSASELPVANCAASGSGASCTENIYGLNYTITSTTTTVNYTPAGSVTATYLSGGVPTCPMAPNGTDMPANSATMTVISSIGHCGSPELERFQDRCALSIFNARSPLLGVGSTWVDALGYCNPETAIAGGASWIFTLNRPALVC